MAGQNMTPLIRLATESDAEAILAIYAPIVRETPISFEYDVPSIEEMGQRIHDKLAHGYPWLVAEQSGRIMGYAYGGRWRERAAYQWTVEVTVYVNPAFQRMGVGRALYTALFGVLRLQGFITVVAGITLPNEGSVRLHEAVGFKPVGVYQRVGYKFDLWHDVGWWGCGLQSPPATPQSPLDYKPLVGSPGWEAALATGVALLRA
jgi:phosphinothricin acetyltransferase